MICTNAAGQCVDFFHANSQASVLSRFGDKAPIGHEYPLGANRVLWASFNSFVPLSALKLMRRFIKRFGPSSPIPKRREPFANGMIASLVTLQDNLDLWPLGLLSCASIERASWRAAIAVSTSTSFRKAEIFLSNEATLLLSWSHISWIFGGKPVS